MQRPRRTCEFSEDTAGVAKRQSSRTRQTTSSIAAPSPNPSTAQKLYTRQSRIARPSNMDASGHRLTVEPTSALRNRTTPQKTPQQRATITNRVLFTGEKHRATTGGVSGTGGALHNDKKWVAEQMQRIVEHLRMAASRAGSVGGIGHEFFERPGCLKQMSIKQFVAIVNYFLGHIPGNRFQVGTNHVEDIISVLQKLRYPHQINKSSLKTPAAPHSSGNIVMMFDFLMDFVPDGDCADELHFPVAENPEQTISATLSEEEFHSPDSEFQAHLLQSVAEGFVFWDTSTQDEYEKLQQVTCELLIMKRCNVASVAVLEAEIERLAGQLDELEKRRPPRRTAEELQCRNLRNEIKGLMNSLQMCCDEYDNDHKDLKQLESRRSALREKADQLRDDIELKQQRIRKQKCSAVQRNALIDEVDQLKNMLQVQIRTVDEIQNRNYGSEVLLSRIKKDVTANVEAFNKHMREISYAQVAAAENLQVSLNPQTEQVAQGLQLLRELAASIEEAIQQLRAGDEQLSAHNQQVSDEIELHMMPHLKKLQMTVQLTEEKTARLEAFLKRDHCNLDMKLSQLEAELMAANGEIEQVDLTVAAKRKELHQLQQDNEEALCRVEREHKQLADAREQKLREFNKALEQGNEYLKQWKEQVERDSSEMKRIAQKYQRNDKRAKK